MEQTLMNIYIPSGVDTTGFPGVLSDDFEMSVDYKIESSWMFYLMLKGQGLQVRICMEYPQEGILLVHKAFVKHFVWNPELFVISMQWDYKRDDRAQVHLVSNKYKTHSSSLGWMDRFTFSGLQYFVQPPMHPVLIPRSSERGDRFENVAFIGAEKNLESEFRTDAFRDGVARLGMKFVIVDDPGKMTDYSEIDAILAVRKIGRLVCHKPAQKLINAWRAGVPSILGCEVGYRELKESALDYMEGDSVEDVVEALKRLKDDVAFRHALVQNGLRKAEDYNIAAVERRLGELFLEQIIPAYAEWKSMSIIRQSYFLCIRKLRYTLRIFLSFVSHRVFGIHGRV